MPPRNDVRPRRVTACLILLLAGSSLTGCESQINPYLGFEDRPNPDTGGMAVNSAVKYANGVKDRYRRAVGDEATFQRLLGVGLIGTASALPIMALANASTKSLGIVGVSGAGVYALGTWLQSTPRQRAYIQGYKAVTCAVEAVLPLAFISTDSRYKDFNTAMGAIPASVTEVQKGVSAVQKIVTAVQAAIRAAKDAPAPSKASNGNDLAEAKRLKGVALRTVARARGAIAEAETAKRRGIEVQFRIGSAGARLTGAVDRIIGEVDTAVQANSSDLLALPGIIGGLGRIYGEFPGAPPVSPFQPSDEAIDTGEKKISALNRAVARLPTAVESLEGKIAALVEQASKIADFVALLSHVQPVEALKACGVDAKAVVTETSVEPATASFSGPGNETRSFLVRGGASPYIISLTGTDTDKISFDQPIPFGPVFTLTVQADAPAGEYVVLVTDGSRRIVPLQFDVAARKSEGE